MVNEELDQKLHQLLKYLGVTISEDVHRERMITDEALEYAILAARVGEERVPIQCKQTNFIVSLREVIRQLRFDPTVIGIDPESLERITNTLIESYAVTPLLPEDDIKVMDTLLEEDPPEEPMIESIIEEDPELADIEVVTPEFIEEATEDELKRKRRYRELVERAIARLVGDPDITEDRREYLKTKLVTYIRKGDELTPDMVSEVLFDMDDEYIHRAYTTIKAREASNNMCNGLYVVKFIVFYLAGMAKSWLGFDVDMSAVHRLLEMMTPTNYPKISASLTSPMIDSAMGSWWGELLKLALVLVKIVFPSIQQGMDPFMRTALDVFLGYATM